ncbi:hypothetical protein BHYA_0046g00120 [Botrytis hyacinthi]|uniref:Uncharacterized protein n=1 Tax=Botrytis hyacinthi TaxID=278943 RepID=A0A4Z1GW17_9HELO|nr:hypothetical protein BHYA_0046g00120 [Botrytis hyacinthi]
MLLPGDLQRICGQFEMFTQPECREWFNRHRILDYVKNDSATILVPFDREIFLPRVRFNTNRTKEPMIYQFAQLPLNIQEPEKLQSCFEDLHHIAAWEL